MFGNKKQPQGQLHPFEQVSVTTIRRVGDGSEILYGLARQVEAAGRPVYAEQIRNAAHAIIEAVQSHPGHPSDYTEDHVMGAGEHASAIRQALRLT